MPTIVDYSSKTTPEDYKCYNCGTTQCKMWRDSGSLVRFRPSDMLCVDCAAKHGSKDISTMTETGLRKDSHGMQTDSIGWYVPAVPLPDNSGYWGYSQVPDAGCKWWTNLPLRSRTAK